MSSTYSKHGLSFPIHFNSYLRLRPAKAATLKRKKETQGPKPTTVQHHHIYYISINQSHYYSTVSNENPHHTITTDHHNRTSFSPQVGPNLDPNVIGSRVSYHHLSSFQIFFLSNEEEEAAAAEAEKKCNSNSNSSSLSCSPSLPATTSHLCFQLSTSINSRSNSPL